MSEFSDKGGQSRCGVDRTIVRELEEEEITYPGIMVLQDKLPNYLDESLVRPFSRSIGLGIVSLGKRCARAKSLYYLNP